MATARSAPCRVSPKLSAGAAFLALSFHVGPAAAATYYVDGMNGFDSNQGSEQAPFRSFRRGIAALAPGDTLKVAAGRYSEPLVVSRSGTAEKPISIVGQDRPLIETADDAINIIGSYVAISGFEAHSLGLGSAIDAGKGNHHIRISNNVARDSGCNGIALIQTDYAVIEDNRVFGNARRSPWQCSGISIYQPINFDHETGIHNVIRRNLVYDNMNQVVDDKITHSGGKTTDGNGIIFDDSRHTQGGAALPPYDALTLIENNIAVDNGGRGINVFLSGNVVVRNNTAYHNLKDPNLASRSSQAEYTAVFANDVLFVNNIAVPQDSAIPGFAAYQCAPNCVWDYNLVESVLGAGQIEQGWGPHNLSEKGAADFMSPSIDPSAANFSLRDGSRALGAGDVHNAPTDDFSGAPRPVSGPIDLGALQKVRKPQQ